MSGCSSVEICQEPAWTSSSKRRWGEQPAAPFAAHTDALVLDFDSNYGPFPAKVQSEEGALRVDGKRLAVFRERDWTKLNWSDVGAEIILECSGRGTRRAEAEKHLGAGAKRVLISAPAK